MKIFSIVYSNTKTIVSRLNPEIKIIWVGIFILVNLLHFCIISDYFSHINKIYNVSGDSEQYVQSVENFINTGEFTFMKSNKAIFASNCLDENNYDKAFYYTFRTPGFAFFYYPLRFVFSQHNALTVLILMQVIVNAIAKYILCLLAYKLFKSKLSFVLLFSTLTINTYSSYYNSFLYTESLSVSMLIFAIFFLHKWRIMQNYKLLLISGLFLTLAAFLRPFLFPIFLFPILIIISKGHLKLSAKNVLIFLIPLFLIDGLWCLRNYYKTNEFIPIASTMKWRKFSNRAFEAQIKICERTNTSFLWWEKNSLTYWFEHKKDSRPPLRILPAIFFTDMKDTNLVSLSKNLYQESKDSSLNKNARAIKEIQSAKILDNLLTKYKKTHPNDYYFFAQVKTFFHLLNQPLFKRYISIKYPFNVLTVFIESLTIRFGFVLGLLSCFWGIYYFRKDSVLLFISTIPIFISLLFAFIYTTKEHREVFIPYYFMLFLSVGLIDFLLKNRKKYFLFSILFLLISFGIFDVLTNVKF